MVIFLLVKGNLSDVQAVVGGIFMVVAVFVVVIVDVGGGGGGGGGIVCGTGVDHCCVHPPLTTDVLPFLHPRPSPCLCAVGGLFP